MPSTLIMRRRHRRIRNLVFSWEGFARGWPLTRSSTSGSSFGFTPSRNSYVIPSGLVLRRGHRDIAGQVWDMSNNVSKNALPVWSP